MEEIAESAATIQQMITLLQNEKQFLDRIGPEIDAIKGSFQNIKNLLREEEFSTDKIRETLSEDSKNYLIMKHLFPVYFALLHYFDVTS